MNRREFMQGAVGCVLAFAAPGLVAPTTDPHDIVWARTWLPWQTMKALGQSPASLARVLAFEREGLEADATAQYGRPIAFEVIDEDGQQLRREPGTDDWYVLWRERLDLHPYWKTQLDI